MNQDEVALWVQTAAVRVASGGSLLALWLARQGRLEAVRLAGTNNQAALRHAKLMFDLENTRAPLEI